MRSLCKTGFACALAATLLAGAGCKKKTQEGAGSASATGSAVATGSATATGSGTATGTTPTAMTPEARASWYAQCWDVFNARVWDEFRKCFADDLVEEDLGTGMKTTGADKAVENAKAFAAAFSDGKGEQQLTLVNGTHVASLTLFTGTHDNALESPMGKIPATHKPIAILMAHLIDGGPDAKATHERFLMDSGSMMGQLGLLPPGVPFRGAVEPWAEKPVVIAKGDENETKNVAAYKAGLETFNKHDLKGVEAGFADNAVWSEQTMPKDQTKAEMVKGLEEFWKGFSDMKLDAPEVWGAGDYTVAVGTVSATNDGTFAPMKLEKTGKKFSGPFVEVDHWTGGKVDKAWLLMDSTSMATQLGLVPPPPAK